jgi:osmoprotectant transport system substrate-binding protein
MRKFFAWFVLTLVLVGAIASCTPTSNRGDRVDLKIASKGFTEQDILQELLAQQIENKTQLKVSRRRILGSVAHQAILAGESDAYVEYTGTAYVGYLKQPVNPDPVVTLRGLRQLYAEKFKLEVMPPLGFENTFAMIIRGEDARQQNITTLSEATKYSPQWRAGFGYEFLERQDGFPGLAKAYNLQFAEPPKTMDLGLIYRALTQKKVDFVAGSSTDGQIPRLGLVILKDDKRYFPPYQAVPIVRKATLQKHPQVRAAIAELAGKISSTEMQQLNYQVEGELRDVKEVVREFLRSKNLS